MKYNRELLNKFCIDNDLTLLEWIEHAKQEHMDAILYLEKIKQIASDEEKIY